MIRSPINRWMWLSSAAALGGAVGFGGFTAVVVLWCRWLDRDDQYDPDVIMGGSQTAWLLIYLWMLLHPVPTLVGGWLGWRLAQGRLTRPRLPRVTQAGLRRLARVIFLD